MELKGWDIATGYTCERHCALQCQLVFLVDNISGSTPYLLSSHVSENKRVLRIYLLECCIFFDSISLTKTHCAVNYNAEKIAS